jgi:hypothetical protein
VLKGNSCNKDTLSLLFISDTGGMPVYIRENRCGISRYDGQENKTSDRNSFGLNGH